MNVNDSMTERYLRLLKKSLLNVFYLENEARIGYFVDHLFKRIVPPIPQAINEFLKISEGNLYPILRECRTNGSWMPYGGGDLTHPDEVAARNFLFTAHTMIGAARLDNIHQCLDIIRQDAIPGDLIETGVWKGGATIFMRGYLAAHNIQDRRVWLADSFDGLPKPQHEKDEGWDLSKDILPYLCVSLEEVRELFDRYELLDDQVRFLQGWFKDTLPGAPIERLALLRLDGDLYESTMDSLNNLYDKLSPGGFVIVDDYNAFPQCKEAVQEFRDRHGIVDDLVVVDFSAVYWRKSGVRQSEPAQPPSLIWNLLKTLLK